MRPLNKPRVNVTFADKKIDQNGKLTDEETREKVRLFMIKFVEWIIRLKK